MKVVNIVFESAEALRELIAKNEFYNEKNLLVQFFDGRDDADAFNEIAKLLKNELSQATIVGVSAGGEIIGDKMIDFKVVISFCAFENTTLIPLYTPKCDFDGGVEIASGILKDEIKSALFFSEGINGKPEAFLKGVKSAKNKLVIGGGASADNGKFS